MAYTGYMPIVTNKLSGEHVEPSASYRPLRGLALGDPWKLNLKRCQSKVAKVSEQYGEVSLWHNWGEYFFDQDKTQKNVGLHYWPTNNEAEIRELASRYEGRDDGILLIGNEPEIYSDGLCAPYMMIRTIRMLRRAGFSSKIGLPGCTISMGRWQAWFENYFFYTNELPDYWHIHIYAADRQGFDYWLNMWWEWHSDYGGGRPVIISEVGWTKELYQSLLDTLSDERIHSWFWTTTIDDLPKSWNP